MYEPDPQTIDRLRYLSSVGKALNETYSEENLDVGTDFFMALDNLNKYKESLDKLILEEPVRAGMYDLIEYLRKKIQRRLGYTGAKN